MLLVLSQSEIVSNSFCNGIRGCGGSQSSFLAKSLTTGIRAFKSVFDERFRRSFPLAKDVDTPEYFSFAKGLVSNLLGGIGYFHGDSIVDNAFAQEWDDEDAFNSAAGGKSGEPTIVEPRGLLTATPSRSFFPRGFYW